MSMTAVAASTDRRGRPLVQATVGIGLVAAAGTAAVAAALHAAGAPLAAHGEVPIAAFAQFTFVGAVLGGLLVAALNRRSASPRRRFVQTAVALTALTCVAPVALGSDTASVLALIATHLVAAAMIIPVLARQLTD